jgi:hypothetical protein
VAAEDEGMSEKELEAEIARLDSELGGPEGAETVAAPEDTAANPPPAEAAAGKKKKKKGKKKK